MALRKPPPPPVEKPDRSRPRERPASRRAGARRGSSPACAGASGSGTVGDRALRRRRRAQRPPRSTPTAPGSPGGACGSSRGPRGARWRRPACRASRTGAHGGFRLELPAGPSRRVTVAFGGEERLDRRAPRRAALLRVRGGVVFHAAPTALRDRPGGAALGPGPGPGGAASAARQAGRDPVPGGGDRALAAGARHPQRPRGHFRARYRFRYVSGTARIRLRAVALSEERWPYAPGASRPLAVRVSG